MGETDFFRMALMPKIRPLSFGESAKMDDPEQGKVKMGGTGGGVIDLNLSVSHTINRQVHEEAKRTFDIVRVNYTRPDGTIDPNTFIEMEVVREINFGSGAREAYAKPEIKQNMELVAQGLTRYNR